MTTPGSENFDAVILARHIANLRRLGPKHMRQDYLANLERREGKEKADKVRQAFSEDWEQRKAQERTEGLK